MSLLTDRPRGHMAPLAQPALVSRALVQRRAGQLAGHLAPSGQEYIYNTVQLDRICKYYSTEPGRTKTANKNLDKQKQSQLATFQQILFIPYFS